MLFNSYEFILGFLPLTLIGFFLIGRRSPRLAAAFLAFASFVFYAWWDVRYVALLAASILANYTTGYAIARAHRLGRPRLAKGCTTLGVGVDLALLGYFKYAGFFVRNVDALTGLDWHVATIVLPLGISFFTFTQIAFLVDVYQRKARDYNLVHYALFVTYFPHLIAGPILHHKEMMPQFAAPRTYAPHALDFAVGLTIFVIGLFKKTVLADGIAEHASAPFAMAAAGSQLAFFQAWGAALAYTLQLYFDFSGYSDMAIGLSRLIGVRLPLNFDSPYKAASIVDFWRRWHMTLSRFLRDYLYFPLGGNRRGNVRRYANLLVTMLLGGLWHGAGWTFVVWGGLHGLYLCVNHGWQRLRERLGMRGGTRISRVLAGATTFVAVVVGWVFFRAQDLPTALSILAGMAGAHGFTLPDAFVYRLSSFATVLTHLGLRFTPGGGAAFVKTCAWIAVLLPVVFLWPNTQEIMSRFRPALGATLAAIPRWQRWSPRAGWAAFAGVVAAAGLLSLNRHSEFLYFQF
jgi:D-alanyl-lipoteichoic acid acyltransferase DltB (MBOAT superfamily)